MVGLLDHLKSEAAVIEGAPISFMIAIAICVLILSMVYRQRFALLRDERDDYKYALEAAAPAQLATRIKLFDLDDRNVGREFLVSGSAKPMGSAVQVLLRGADNRWYPQERPRFDGTRWRARCWAGSESTPSGAMFKVIAVDSTVLISEPVAELPSGIARSKEVTVYRL